METFLACVVGLVLVVGLVALFRRIRATRSVLAAEVLLADRDAAAVDDDVRAVLVGVPGATVAPLEPGHVRVVLRRAPAWTVAVAVLAFPVGLVALLHREDVPLDVWVYATPAGTQVQLSGPTEAHVLARVRAALLGVPGVREGQVVGV
ncbi:hypothetical protein G5V58_21235 [Nocardioides anomalus]|uniref:Uncharacterized protein n=1 Tax=Nocardioides anomalus TaxID=2712223 RepID=A0A6G6WIC2_9ACTN|nr:hypothetical protein [Nocardioides anomalus]QIG44956.1 hypothetical protein G5V58_21235 [Nocardioides anomalus]